MRPLKVVPIAVLVAACSPQTQYAGRDVFEYFALDGQRAWEYVNDASDVDWVLRVEKSPQSRKDDDTEIFTLEYAKKDPAELYFSVDWSSDSNDGVLVHGWTDLGTGTAFPFSEPLVFSDAQMNPDETVESSSDGISLESTFVAVEDCQNHWVSEPWTCLHFELDDGGAGLPFAGSWWIAADWGASSMQLTDWSEPWVLTKGEWDPDE